MSQLANEAQAFEEKWTRNHIDEDTTTSLTQKQFDELSTALEEPMPATTQALLQRTPVWKQIIAPQ